MGSSDELVAKLRDGRCLADQCYFDADFAASVALILIWNRFRMRGIGAETQQFLPARPAELSLFPS